jgi:hypothetical protein
MESIEIALVKPPALKSYDRTVIIQFLEDWDKYIYEVSCINSVVLEDTKSKRYNPVNVRDVIDSSLLYTIVVYHLDKEESDIKTVTDEANCSLATRESRSSLDSGTER